METEISVSEIIAGSLADPMPLEPNARRYFEQGRRIGKTARLASLLVGLDSESPEGDITAGAGHSDEDWERITAAQRKRERKHLRNKINEGVKDFGACLVPVRRYTLSDVDLASVEIRMLSTMLAQPELSAPSATGVL